MKSINNYVSLLFMLIIFFSCKTIEKHRYREGDRSAEEINISYEEERQMTEEILFEFKKDFPPYSDKLVQDYISELGMKIVRANNLENNPYNYSFAVVSSEQVNAFALPAGVIFVTLPLLAMVETEAELAGVLSHEIGHVVARHAAYRIDKARRETGKTLLYTLGGGVLGGALGYGLGRIFCAPDDKECLEGALSYGAFGGTAAAMLIQKYYFLANSREDEMEADRIGFRLATNAGYSKDYVGKFYERLLEMERQRKTLNIEALNTLEHAFSTHPPSLERVEQMNELVLESYDKNGIVNTESFLEVKKRVK